jgi:primase-polymerase (primpol)-like protein
MRDNKPTKVPIDPRTGRPADSTDPATWSTFRAALALVRQVGAAGVGYVPLPENGLTFIDLDACIANDTVTEWAQRIVDELSTYTERSPSGCGLRIICRGSKPDTRRSKRGGIELYDGRQKDGTPGGRFLTISGHRLSDTPDGIRNRQTAIEAIYRRELSPTSAAGGGIARPTGLTDAEVLTRAARCATGTRFRPLWRGDWQGAGYTSQSEADLSLVGMLLFWSGDPAQVDRLFRRSGLMRPKWERPDYRQGTLDTALSTRTAYYTGGRR